MIKHLRIQNYALIEKLDVVFSEGLTIITGETGAGKSILLGALGLIMGRRADTKVLYDESEKCVVEGVFDVSRYNLQPFFTENELDYDTEVVVRREISPSGKTRAFVNDTPVNLKVLEELSGSLVDLHQQFDTQDINSMSFQLRMLDALANTRHLLTEYRNIYLQYQHKKKELASLLDVDSKNAQEAEFWQFQWEELQVAELQSGEQVQLEAELNRQTNAEDIKRAFNAVYQCLNEGELPLIPQLEVLCQTLQGVQKYDLRAASIYQRLYDMLVELRETARDAEKQAELTEFDPERILECQQRLDAIYRLQTKHRVADVDELIAIRDDLENKLKGISNQSETIRLLQEEIRQLDTELRHRAADLRSKRQAVVATFVNEVQDMLALLAMEHAVMQVRFDELPEPGAFGMDEVQFLFAANKGSRLQSIRDVASGGEMSRLALVIKSLVASAIPLPTLIFDEIDSGVSGDVAQKMGQILGKLSQHHQLVTITHSPQVAAQADSHYFVYKQVKDDRTYTKMRELSPDECVRAIAVMLSQNPPSDAALENARQLLGVRV